MNIKELTLFTAQLALQSDFYEATLGLEKVEETTTSVSFKVGDSILKFVQRDNVTPYHFAFNIPSNQAEGALNWLKQRVKILKDEDSEIQYFNFWDAYAVYFYDKEHNIVEFIARKRLNYELDKPFDQSCLLNISEIGLPTKDIQREFNLLNSVAGIPLYSGSIERFCAAGDDHGLFILINKRIKKEWFPTYDKPYSSDFVVRFTEGEQEFCFEYFDEVLINQATKI